MNSAHHWEAHAYALGARTMIVAIKMALNLAMIDLGTRSVGVHLKGHLKRRLETLKDPRLLEG